MDHNILYRELAGENAPQHIFNENGICIRCGEDAEEWEAGCIEELTTGPVAAETPKGIRQNGGRMEDGK